MKTTRKARGAYQLRLVAWEVTKRCAFNCRHCRASAAKHSPPGELTTEECFKVLDNIASFASPVIIITGGEPMLRDDLFQIARHGSGLGLKMVMATGGGLMTGENAVKMKEAGIKRISLSIDGAERKTHDSFRRAASAFDAVIKAAGIVREAGLEFQINTTVTKLNYKEIDRILRLAADLGAVSYHPFLLVPAGRGKNLARYELNPNEYESFLIWIYEKQKETPIRLKPTCAPQYHRIYRQKEKEAGRREVLKARGLDTLTKGCMAGQSFAFISNTGKVQACGFLEVETADIRREGYDFRKIWKSSELFLKIRDSGNYNGRCGICEYGSVCGGCRARAFAATGDYLGEEPYCIYQPKRKIQNFEQSIV